MIGQTTSHYPILDDLGEGGMWLLYRPPDNLPEGVPRSSEPPHTAACLDDYPGAVRADPLE